MVICNFFLIFCHLAPASVSLTEALIDYMSTEVTWTEQQNINEFSKLNSRLNGHEDALASIKTEMELVDDVSLELELVDEDEEIPYRIGDALVYLKQQEVMERLEKRKEGLEERLKKRESQIDDEATRMDGLKKSLYAKFGRENINLERD